LRGRGERVDLCGAGANPPRTGTGAAGGRSSSAGQTAGWGMKEPVVRFQDILEGVSLYAPEADIPLLRKAYVFAAVAHRGQLRKSGAPYLSHPLAVTRILTDLKMDTPALCAGLLHDVIEDCTVQEATLQQIFGAEISALVTGLTKTSGVTLQDRRRAKLENYRKMIIAMSKDIRILMIKLADRLHNMRTLASLNEEQKKRISEETLAIYAPLANRLGISWMRAELEDLSFRYVQPEAYQEIVRGVDDRVHRKQSAMETISRELGEQLEAEGIPCEISGRVKHYYSVYRKLQRQGIDLDQVFDLVALRVIVPTEKHCYQVLGLTHAAWTPIPSRFKDYIAQPKMNGYRTLHTTVSGIHGDCVEIQIRTREMHREAEQGVASHWMYKEHGGFDQKDEKTFQFLRTLLSTLQEISEPRRFLDTMRLDLFPDQVYVLTPRGEVKELPRGSTPIDFAYKIHTEVGNHCSGAKVGGRIVPLRYELNNGDVIEILTSKSMTPKKDWLSIVKTPEARSRIRAWLRSQELEQVQSLGREMLEKGLRKAGYQFAKLAQGGEIKSALKTLQLKDMDELLQRVGAGKTTVHQFVEALPQREEDRGAHDWNRDLERLIEKAEKRSDTGVLVPGVPHMMVRFAKCCNPVHGEEIVGFITHGRGLTIHVRTCPKARSPSDRDRWIDVQWDEVTEILHRARIRVVCEDQPGLLAGISKTIAAANVNISHAQIRTTGDQQGIAFFEVMVRNLDHLEALILSIEKVKGVLSVDRVAH